MIRCNRSSTHASARQRSFTVFLLIRSVLFAAAPYISNITLPSKRQEGNVISSRIFSINGAAPLPHPALNFGHDSCSSDGVKLLKMKERVQSAGGHDDLHVPAAAAHCLSITHTVVIERVALSQHLDKVLQKYTNERAGRRTTNAGGRPLKSLQHRGA